MVSTTFLMVPTTIPQSVQPTKQHTNLKIVLHQLNTINTFMITTTHPNNKNNTLLTLLTKNQNIHTILITTTQKNEKQNKINPKLFDTLTILQTKELLTTHQLDKTEQYFTQTIDFNYSFNHKKTFNK